MNTLTLTVAERETIRLDGLLDLLNDCEVDENGEWDEDFNIFIPNGTATYTLSRQDIAVLQEACDPEKYEPFLRRKLEELFNYGALAHFYRRFSKMRKYTTEALAIPIVGAWFWGSVAYLMVKGAKDELFKQSPRRIPSLSPEPTIDQTTEAETELLVHAAEKFDWSLIHEPEPMVVKPRRKRKAPSKKRLLDKSDVPPRQRDTVLPTTH